MRFSPRMLRDRRFVGRSLRSRRIAGASTCAAPVLSSRRRARVPSQDDRTDASLGASVAQPSLRPRVAEAICDLDEHWGGRGSRRRLERAGFRSMRIVDDGIATGDTAWTAIEALRTL